MNMEFSMIFMLLLMSFIMSTTMLLVSFILGLKTPSKEKVTMYECGFNPFHNPGKPFSMSFFLMAMLFLIFDLEVSYLFPWSMGTNLVNLYGQLMVMMFMLLLTIGLLYEWMKGGLDWE